MKIRHAAEKDFPQIMKIYEYARHFMAEHGNPNQYGVIHRLAGDGSVLFLI